MGLIPHHPGYTEFPVHYFAVGSWKNVEKIEITYTAEQDNSLVYRFYKIEAIEKMYYSNTGEPISADLIRSLMDSFTDFYESPYQSSYNGSFYDYSPHFTVVITLVNGVNITLKSDSHYHCFIPWNITYKDNSYVQYNGKIPSALLNILMKIDRELWLPFDKEARWGCLSAAVPNKYPEGPSPQFSHTEPAIPPEEEEGKNHVLWKKSLSGVPVAVEYWKGKVYVTVEDRLVSLDAETGDILWQVTFGQKGKGAPCETDNILVHQEVVYVGAPDSWVYSIDGETGSVLWKYKTDASSCFPVTIAGNTLAAVTGGITCLERETGQLIWEITDDTWNEEFQEDKILFAGFGEDYESYYALADIGSGEVVWKENFFDIWRPVYHEGVLYFCRPQENAFVSVDVETTTENFLYVYDLPLREVRILDHAVVLVLTDEHEEFIQSVVVIEPEELDIQKYTYPHTMRWESDSEVGFKIYQERIFFVRENGFMEAFALENGGLIWKTEVRGTQITNFHVYENRMYLSANDGKIYCLNLKNGKILWIAVIQELIQYPGGAFVYIPVIEDRLLVAITEEGGLYAFSV